MRGAGDDVPGQEGGSCGVVPGKGAALVPLLMRMLDRCKRGRRVVRNAEDAVSTIPGVLLHMTRILELLLTLVGHPGILVP